jgi:hypothetical protein
LCGKAVVCSWERLINLLEHILSKGEVGSSAVNAEFEVVTNRTSTVTEDRFVHGGFC